MVSPLVPMNCSDLLPKCRFPVAHEMHWFDGLKFMSKPKQLLLWWNMGTHKYICNHISFMAKIYSYFPFLINIHSWYVKGNINNVQIFAASWKKCLVLEFGTGWRRTLCGTARNAPKMLKPRSHPLWNQPKHSPVQPSAHHLPTPATPVATNPSPHPPFATRILPHPAQLNPPKGSLLCLLLCPANTHTQRKAQVCNFCCWLWD